MIGIFYNDSIAGGVSSMLAGMSIMFFNPGGVA
jgi:hypothetical protein